MHNKYLKILNFFILAGCIISLNACEKDEPNKLSVNEDRLMFSEEGGTSYIIINTDADSWNITNPASEWLTLSSTSGTLKKAYISLTVNSKTRVPRIDTLTINAGDAAPVNVAVSQASSEYLYIINASAQKIEFPETGDTTTLTIQTNAKSWSIDNPASEWLTLSADTGSQEQTEITLIVDTRTKTPRNDTITITADYAKPVMVSVSQIESEYLYGLNVNKENINFSYKSGSSTFDVTTDASEWNVTTDADWIQLSSATGMAGTSSIHVDVTNNTVTKERSSTITINAEYAPVRKIMVTQKGALYPNYNTDSIAPDMNGMNSTAIEITNKMTLGWNIGNTLEAIGGETKWGNPKITEAYIQSVKENGFNAIRLPCSWNQYSNYSNAQISDTWLNRVKQVVQYCVDNDMYVLLNIHWDGGWLENNVTPTMQERNNAKQKAFWQQIATHLRDFDEHLLFAGANEPNVENSTQQKVLMSYHQTFIDAVRSTGGRNAYRVLVIQGPSTDIEKTNSLMNTLPTDRVENKLMMEIHYYTPYQFCLMNDDTNWGKMFYYWGEGHHSTIEPGRNATWGEEDDVDRLFGMMKKKFVDKGIPVIMGEYGAYRRTNTSHVPQDLETHNDAIDYWITYTTQQAIANGIIPFYWDTGGALSRGNNTVLDQRTIDALNNGAQ